LAVSRNIRNAPSDTHLYGALFAGAALSFCLGHLTANRFSLASDLFAVAGDATCGWSWLLARALFHKPETRRPLWPLGVVLGIAVAGAILRFCGDRHAALPRMIGNVESLVSSTILLFAMLEPLIGNYREMPKTEQRFRLIFAGCYAAMLAIGMVIVDGAPAGSLAARWAGTIQMGCAMLALLGMGLAVRYRDRNPMPDLVKVTRRAPSAEESALGKRLLRLVIEDTAYALADLKLADLARRLGEPDYKVTQCITGALGFRNFNHMINHFRIEEAKRRLADPRCDHLPILTIALDCGFGSIGPFNRAFKVEVGVTPTDFRKAGSVIVTD
jgi:AraC-like DNA-binding protein